MEYAERLLDLVTFLLNADRPVSFREIRDEFPDYAGASFDAAARKFERDKAALADLGIPVVYVEPEDDGEEGGYRIPPEAYFLPRLELAPDELALLYVAGSAAREIPGFPWREEVARALEKIAFAAEEQGAVPAPLARRLAVHAVPGAGGTVGAHFSLLRDALDRQKQVRLRYRGLYRDETTERAVDPYGLFLRDGTWCLYGWCHLRREPRTFHLDRILALEVNRSRPRSPDYALPDDMDLGALARQRPWEYPIEPPTEVVVDLAPRHAFAAQALFGDDAAATPGGSLEGARVTLEVRHLDALLDQVLSLSDGATLVSPPEARARLVARLEGVLAAAPERVEEAAPRWAPPAAPAEPPGPQARAPRPAVPERIRRLLLLVPWAARRPEGIPVTELARRLDLDPERLSEELDFLLMVGKPPFNPGDFLDVYVEGDRVHVDVSQSLTRPPRLTHDEALSLLVGSQALLGDETGEWGQALRGVLDKLEEALLPAERDRYRRLAGRIVLGGGVPGDEGVHAVLRRAVGARQAVRMTYYSAWRDTFGERTVTPYGILFHGGYWYLVAGPEGEEGYKMYRLDRIRDAQVEGPPEAFEVPAHLDLGRLAPRRFAREGGEPPVRVRVRDDHARWAEAFFDEVRVLERADGAVVYELPTATWEWAARWVLARGGAAEVLSPPGLARWVRDRAGALRERYRAGR